MIIIENIKNSRGEDNLLLLMFWYIVLYVCIFVAFMFLKLYYSYIFTFLFHNHFSNIIFYILQIGYFRRWLNNDSITH